MLTLGDKPPPEARAPGLICRGKRVASENQGLSSHSELLLVSTVCQEAPQNPAARVISSLASEHSYPLENIPLIPPSLLWPSIKGCGGNRGMSAL